HQPLLPRSLPSSPTRRSSDLMLSGVVRIAACASVLACTACKRAPVEPPIAPPPAAKPLPPAEAVVTASRGSGLAAGGGAMGGSTDRKSTRLNSSHLGIPYAVF